MSKKLFTFVSFLGMFIFCVASASPALSQEQLPLNAFYQRPSITNVRLSPDATRIVALKHNGEETAIMVMDLASGDVFYPANNDNKKFKINWVDWANNNRILMSVLFLQREPELGFKHKVPNTRLLSIEAKKNAAMINLVKRKEINQASVAVQYPTQFQDNVIGKIAGDPDHILVSVDNKIAFHQTVYKVNVNDAKSKVVKQEDGSYTWIADRQGTVRLGIDFDPRSQKISFKILDPKTNEWTRAWSYVLFKDAPITPLGFGKNPNDLYLLTEFNGSPALYKADLAKEGYPWKFMLSSVTNKTEGSLLFSEALGEIIGLYNKNGGDHIIFLNEDLQRFQTGLNRALPNTLNQIAHLSDDGRKYILKTSTSINPGSYYFGDRDTKQLTPLFELYPDLKNNVLVDKKRLSFTSRDGVELTGYLSTPKNNVDKPIATIIIPQGEPISENGALFDPFSAYLVNRGYAVFQPMPRDIKEKDTDLLQKIAQGNGTSLQNDIEDGAAYLIQQKIAAPNKVGILGGSYGGYAALMGTTKTPGFFRCAISIAGISNISPLLDFMHYTKSTESLSKTPKEISMESPVNNVSNIKAPILLIHDEDDQNIPVEQSRMMADELKRQKKTYQYIELKEGDHQLTYLPQRKQTFEAIDAFLKKYLPVE